MTPSEIGNAIRERRKELRLTQEKLAAQVGCSQTAIGRLERGETGRPRELATILAALGISLDQIDDGTLRGASIGRDILSDFQRDTLSATAQELRHKARELVRMAEALEALLTPRTD